MADTTDAIPDLPTDLPDGWAVVKIVCTGGEDRVSGGRQHRRRVIRTYWGEPIPWEDGHHVWHDRTTRERTIFDQARLSADDEVVEDPRLWEGTRSRERNQCPSCPRNMPFRLDDKGRATLDQLAAAGFDLDISMM